MAEETPSRPRDLIGNTSFERSSARALDSIQQRLQHHARGFRLELLELLGKGSLEGGGGRSLPERSRRHQAPLEPRQTKLIEAREVGLCSLSR